jgi:protein-L-isoaspartate(D-aspartate) O-methyltransferase
MMNDEGTVIGVEHISSLVKHSIENINKNHSDLIKNNKIFVIDADARKGFPQYAPYNCIHVGAGINY